MEFPLRPVSLEAKDKKMLTTRFAVQGVDIQTLDWHNKTFYALI